METDAELACLADQAGRSQPARRPWRAAKLLLIVSVLLCAALGALIGCGHSNAFRGLGPAHRDEGAATIGLSLSDINATLDHREGSHALSVLDAWNGTVALQFSNGRYVSSDRHGILSANAGAIGPDETFKVTENPDDTISLQSSYGKYVRSEKNGSLAAASSTVGHQESFTKIANGTRNEERHSWFYLQTNSLKYLGEKRVKVRLLTSAFVPRGDTSEHMNEIFAAIQMNILNDLIDEVHILTESDCAELVQVLRHWSSKMPNTTRILVKMDQKLTCAMMRSENQPTYREFFMYANTTIHDGLLIISNADVVFDETLRRLEPAKIIGNKYGYVLSVRPPPLDGDYKAVFGKECRNTLRCTVGRWSGGGDWGQSPGSGSSWDAYVLAPPLPGNMDLDHIATKMNLYGAENLAAYQLDANGGLELYNPCEHIYAFHWHCLGGKMHSTSMTDRVDRPLWYTQMKGLPKHSPPDALDGLLPCWYCPGVKMPGGTVPRKELCRNGTELGVDAVPKLRSVFVMEKIAVKLCCAKATCGELNVEYLPQCRLATDTNCLIWDISGWPHFY